MEFDFINFVYWVFSLRIFIIKFIEILNCAFPMLFYYEFFKFICQV